MPIPQPQPSLLSQNPQFAKLWQDITNPDNRKGKIRSDGTTNVVSTSTSSKKGATATAAIFSEDDAKRLRELRLRARRRAILLRGLRNAAAATEDREHRDVVADEVREVMLTVSVLVEQATNKGISAKEFELLEYGGIARDFEENIDAIARAVGNEIQRERKWLADLLIQPPPASTPSSTSTVQTHQQQRLFTTSTKPAKLHHHSSSSSSSSALTHRHRDQPLPLQLPPLPSPSTPAPTTALPASLCATLTATTALQTTLISHLELHMHGHVARHTRARLTHLATVAEGMRLKSGVLVGRGTEALYGAGSRQALERYATHLETAVATGLREREARVREALEMYGGHGDGDAAMRRKKEDLARRYGLLLGEEERVRGEIRRVEEDSERGDGRGSGSARGVGKLVVR